MKNLIILFHQNRQHLSLTLEIYKGQKTGIISKSQNIKQGTNTIHSVKICFNINYTATNEKIHRTFSSKSMRSKTIVFTTGFSKDKPKPQK